MCKWLTSLRNWRTTRVNNDGQCGTFYIIFEWITKFLQEAVVKKTEKCNSELTSYSESDKYAEKKSRAL